MPKGWRGGPATIICQECGASFQKAVCLVATTKYCSKPCRNAVMSRKRMGAENPSWKPEGRSDQIHKGRLLLYRPEHPSSAKSGYILAYRLIMEQHLGRLLLTTEHVHHLNGDPSDNRIENLQLVSASVHRRIHMMTPVKDPVTGRFIRKEAA